jgi:hypothetical protein
MDEIERLTRWAAHGGTCQLVELDAGRADVVLCRCDGGEEVERFTTLDPAVMAWVRENES